MTWFVDLCYTDVEGRPFVLLKGCTGFMSLFVSKHMKALRVEFKCNTSVCM
jgi:hypothetical protein